MAEGKVDFGKGGSEGDLEDLLLSKKHHVVEVKTVEDKILSS